MPNKQAQFVQRTSKFRAQDLSLLCIGMGQDIASYSLTRLCGVLESETGVLISPEGLNLRLNTKSGGIFTLSILTVITGYFCPSPRNRGIASKLLTKSL